MFMSATLVSLACARSDGNGPNDPPMPGASRRILLMEDEQFTAPLIEQSLLAQGFDVRTAPDAAQALAEADRFAPDAALIDISLGDGPSGLGAGGDPAPDGPRLQQ